MIMTLCHPLTVSGVCNLPPHSAAVTEEEMTEYQTLYLVSMQGKSLPLIYAYRTSDIDSDSKATYSTYTLVQ